MRSPLLVALLAAAAALLVSLGVERVDRPPGVFLKYPKAVEESPEVQAERRLDYSPLYLAFTRVLYRGGRGEELLRANAVLHAVLVAASALFVGLLRGPRWAALAGGLAATYRPLLTHCGLHEPEVLLVALLALAALFGLLARRAARSGSRPRARLALAVAGAVALSLAALVRPQWLLLVPVWALWIAGGERGAGRRVAVAVVGSALVVVGPVAVSRSLEAGFPVIMNPGPVFYEGNHPGAAGIGSFPVPVRVLSKAHPESVDYNHVAYRRVAAAILGRPVDAASANRYWGGLAWQAMRSEPGRALALFRRKAAMAGMPYEAHDLITAEDLSRRLRARWPWGFGILVVAAPWLLLARRETLAELAFPLAIAVVSLVVQTAIYPSARQRLPMAGALLLMAPVLASDLWHRRLRGGERRWLPLGLGLACSAFLAWTTGPVAIVEQVGWDEQLRRSVVTVGERMSRVLEGQVRPDLDGSARDLAAAVSVIRRGSPEELGAVLAVLDRLAREHPDLSTEGSRVAVADYWRARALLRLGRRRAAAEAARRAWSIRPGEVRIAALARWLGGDVSSGERWWVEGVDPVSAGHAMAEAARIDGREDEAIAFVRPFLQDLPELWKKGKEQRSKDE